MRPAVRGLMLLLGSLALLLLGGFAACLWAMRTAPPPFRVSLGLLAALCAYYACDLRACISGAPFVPTARSAARRMVLLAGLGPGRIAVDLGSGGGGLLLLAAETGARAIGYEANPFLALFASLRAALSPLRARVEPRWGNLWDAELSEADAVLVYLMPHRMEKLGAMLKERLKPGAVVVTNAFPIEGWVPERVDAEFRLFAYRL